MKLYHYHPQTKEFMSESDARLDPLESELQGKDVFLIPAHATPEKPPDIETEKARCFIGGAWQQIEDHRGVTMYSTVDGHENSMVALGPIPEGYTLLQPTSVFDRWNGEKWLIDEAAKTTSQAVEARALRNALLIETDCKMLEDNPTTKKGEWKTYRQALRDVPSQAGFPTTVTWPAKPE